MIVESVRCQPAVLVIEPVPDWLPELQRELPGYDVRAGVLGLHGESTPSVFTFVDSRVIRLEPFRWVARIRSARSLSPTIVLATGADLSAEWLLRDLGATTVLDAALPRHEILRQCRRLVRSRVAE